jgi:hypothetical protein
LHAHTLGCRRAPPTADFADRLIEDQLTALGTEDD